MNLKILYSFPVNMDYNNRMRRSHFFILKPYFPKKGFTILELAIVVAIITTLSSISVATYSGYVARSRKSAMKTDLLNLHKGLQSFTALSNNFCKNHRKGSNDVDRASGFVNTGMAALLENGMYGSAGKKPNFIGFSRTDGLCGHAGSSAEWLVQAAPSDDDLRKKAIGIGAKRDGSTITGDSNCVLRKTQYTMGVFAHYQRSTWIGMNINNQGFF